jgi:hypothetical protein
MLQVIVVILAKYFCFIFVLFSYFIFGDGIFFDKKNSKWQKLTTKITDPSIFYLPLGTFLKKEYLNFFLEIC